MRQLSGKTLSGVWEGKILRRGILKKWFTMHLWVTIVLNAVKANA